MSGAWYYADLGMCVVKTTVVRIYGQQQWCYQCPSGNLQYNVHDWNAKYPGYYCPPPFSCGQPPHPSSPVALPPSQFPPTPPTSSSGSASTTPGQSAAPSSGAHGPVTGPAPKPPVEGCAPAMAMMDVGGELKRSSFAGTHGQSHTGGFGFSDLDQLAQPLVAGLTPLSVLVGDGNKPTYTQPYKFRVEDEFGHQTVHQYHEGTGPGILCFHPPELIDHMLHGSSVNGAAIAGGNGNPGDNKSRWPTELSDLTVLLHNCGRADGSTGDSSVTRLAFGNPYKSSVLPKSGMYFEHDPSTTVLSLIATASTAVASKVGHLRLYNALDVGQYTTAQLGLLVSMRHGTLVYNADDEEYQYWDGAAWSPVGGGSGDMLAANNLSDVASKPASQYNLINGLGAQVGSPLAIGTKVPVIEGSAAVAATIQTVADAMTGLSSATPVLADEVAYVHSSVAKKTTPQVLLNLIASLSTVTPALADLVALTQSSVAKNATVQTLLDAIHLLTAKTSIVAADELAMIDSAASNVAKRITCGNLFSNSRVIFLTYTGTGVSGVTVALTDTLTGLSLNRAYHIQFGRYDASGTQQHDAYPRGATGTTRRVSDAGSTGTELSLDAPAAGSLQTLTINSTNSAFNGNTVVYEVMAMGTLA